MERLIERLIESLIESLIECLIECLIDCLIECLIDRLGLMLFWTGEAYYDTPCQTQTHELLEKGILEHVTMIDNPNTWLIRNASIGKLQ